MGLIKTFRESFFLYSFIRDPLAITSFVVLFALCVVSFGAPVLAPMIHTTRLQ
ncbi:hypothetical protein DGMP_37110 [Desulfomarina profundi]|uniref:Oligopeptide transport permease C-like N-terminal domain-containing protein n=1 Tax=Desulfomarina profundi TaxID=2772557 RepID=A0A8D5JEV8_9BACT|nr:hypothetical protein [Desulfomarina profundi]BCL63018.1 hypothetical protein DGMP_37110 [Desulfomarina profundi]